MSKTIDEAEAAIEAFEVREKTYGTPNTVEERLAALEYAFNAQSHVLLALAEALKAMRAQSR